MVIITGHQPATVVARDARPAVQRNVRAGCVVGSQDLANEDEEIQHSSVTEGQLNGCRSLAFTKPLIQDVRMGDVHILRNDQRLFGDDFVGLSANNVLPVQDNPK